MRQATIGILVASLLGGLGTGGLAAPVEMKYKMKPGSEYQYRDWMMVAKIDTATSPFGNNEEKTQFEAETLYRQKVLSFQEGLFELENQTVSGQTIIRSGDQEEKKDAEPRTEIVRIDERGLVKSRESPEEEEKGESGFQMPLNSPFEVLESVYDQLLFPSKPVEVGESWTDKADVKLSASHSVSVPIKSTFVRRVKLMGYECAEIKTLFHVPLSAAESQSSPGAMKLEVSGYLEGELWLYFAPEPGLDILHTGTVRGVTQMVSQLPQADQSMEALEKMVIHLKTVLQPAS